MEHPAHLQRDKPVLPRPFFHFLCVKTHRALRPRSRLPKFQPTEPIDEAVVAHVPIPHELLHRHAPGQAIVAGQVGLIELSNGVFGVFKMNAVVDRTYASEEQDAGVGIHPWQ